MTIGIDCRLAGKKHAGIGRYIEELVERVTLDTSIKWVIFLSEKNHIALKNPANVKIIRTAIPHYSLAEQLVLPLLYWREGLDLLHVPHYNVPLLYRGDFVVTIHDLLWHTQNNANATTLPPLIHALKYWAYRWVSRHAVLGSIHLIVPTSAVKREVLRIFPTVESGKISVTYEGVGANFFTHEALPTEKILFYTGSLYPHKNLLCVVQALKELPDYHLYISSARSVFVDTFLREVERHGLLTRVHHLGRLSDEELVRWYTKSFALVQPSSAEGFGLTGIEALAVGLPIIASDIAVFHEVYQDACQYFDHKSVESFAEAVRTLERSDRAQIIRNGIAVAKQYSWDRMAEDTLDIYRALT